MKFLAIITIFSMFIGMAFGQTEQSRGKCVGSEKLGLESRLQNENFCNPYNDMERDCLKNMNKCEWRKENKVCVAINNERVEDMKLCSVIWTQEDCLSKKNQCKWGYKSRSCNAKDQEKKDDVNLCESYDSSESSCKGAAQCFWGSL